MTQTVAGVERSDVVSEMDSDGGVRRPQRTAARAPNYRGFFNSLSRPANGWYVDGAGASASDGSP
jgi:hypothetical protein